MYFRDIISVWVINLFVQMRLRSKVGGRISLFRALHLGRKGNNGKVMGSNGKVVSPKQKKILINKYGLHDFGMCFSLWKWVPSVVLGWLWNIWRYVRWGEIKLRDGGGSWNWTFLLRPNSELKGNLLSKSAFWGTE